MNRILKLSAILFTVALSAACSKQQQESTTDTTNQTSSAPTAVKRGDGKGIVRAIDTAAKTLTLDHNTVPGVMDAMTMDYHVSDPTMLHSVNLGDSVTFTLEDRGEGNFVVTKITPLKK